LREYSIQTLNTARQLLHERRDLIGRDVRQFRLFDAQVLRLLADLRDGFGAISQRSDLFFRSRSLECPVDSFENDFQWDSLVLPVFHQDPIESRQQRKRRSFRLEKPFNFGEVVVVIQHETVNYRIQPPPTTTSSQ